MNANNGWPDPARPGVPLNPTVPGAHWLKGYTEDAWMYDGDGHWWGPGYSHKLDAETVAARYSYLGPTLTPDEASALQKRCEEAERERDALRRDTSQQVTTDEMVRRLQHLGDWQAADRIEALQKRVAKLEALVKEAFREGFEMGKEYGKKLGEFLANGGDARRYETFGLLEHWQTSDSRAALGGKDE